ncbi:MAG: hypothetical protein AAGI91_03610 [Bacteroidota bacterium]
MIPAQSQCTACTHLDRQAAQEPNCEAFPSGIPDEIWTNQVSHTESYPGDGGIFLELIPLDVYNPNVRGEA